MKLARGRRMTRVTHLRAERAGGESRVTALVDGVPLWFACEDMDLTAAPEAFGSALLLASLHRNRPLSIDGAVSETWRDNVRRLSEIWSEWWGYRIAKTEIITRPDRVDRSSGTALAFSCGIDSFHALLTAPRPQILVSVHGFDVPLADDYRMSAFALSAKAVAAATGVKSTIVRTNLREHPSSGRPRLWERSHGGGLASIAHVLSDHLGELTISSSYFARDQRAWGSAIETDPLFSSDRMGIAHYGAHAHREEKIRQIADNPLVQRHLRVCWANRAESGNCSRCGKCLATMLLLAELGSLDSFEVFDGMKLLPSRLDELPHLSTQINIVERIVERGFLPRPVAEATRKLVKRSRRAAAIREYGNRLRDTVLPRA